MPESESARRASNVATPLSRSGRITDTQGHFPWTVVGVLLMAFTMAWYGWLWMVDGKAVGAALILIPLIALFTAPTMVRAARSERSFDLAGLMLVGLAMRFAFAYYRSTHAADAVSYHFYGTRLAASYRALNF